MFQNFFNSFSASFEKKIWNFVFFCRKIVNIFKHLIVLDLLHRFAIHQQRLTMYGEIKFVSIDVYHFDMVV